ncbi:MAG TPA: glycosyltransferase [Verrucomicrobiae bacterium]|nr:glycosyltransferase [Verrucomicrobiae bacterium]
MRFLILNTDYPEFLRWLYTQDSALATRSYEEQLRARYNSLFGVADFYSSNLRKLGHEAWDIDFNNEALQRAWAKEHGVVLPPQRRSLKFYLRGGKVPWINYRPDPSWMHTVLDAQLRHYTPEVVVNQSPVAIPRHLLDGIKPRPRLLVAQIASPFPKGADFSRYDLIVSSLPNFVEQFHHAGLKAELHRLAFEPGILGKLATGGRSIPASFVGTVSRSHRTRVQLLEHLCRRTNLMVWGWGERTLAAKSPIRSRYRGYAWGREMYQVLSDSKLTVNHHIDVAGHYANNLRLFEATGVGTLLITDWKQNIGDLFEPGKEVATYRSPAECAELIEYYLAHEDERKAIARAGQERTLREHTYSQRMQELNTLVQRYLK